MKKTSYIILIIALLFTLFTFNGCENEDPDNNTSENILEGTTISLLNNIKGSDEWIDDNFLDTNPSNVNRGYKVYTLSEEDNALSTVSFTKRNSNDSLSKNLTYRDLTNYKKISITASGSGTLTLKLISTPCIPGGKGFGEVDITLTNTPVTYEFDLTFDNYDLVLQGLTKIALIGNDGETNSGSFNITNFKFSKEDPIEENVINEPSLGIQLPNIYESGNTFSINKNFIDNDNVFSLVETGESTSLTIGIAKPEWAYIKTKVKGDLTGFNKLKINYTGTAGTSFKVKFEGSSISIFETGQSYSQDDPTCSGESQEFIMQQFNSDNLIDSAEKEMFVLIFFEPGSNGTEGDTIEFTNIIFEK